MTAESSPPQQGWNQQTWGGGTTSSRNFCSFKARAVDGYTTEQRALWKQPHMKAAACGGDHGHSRTGRAVVRGAQQGCGSSREGVVLAEKGHERTLWVLEMLHPGSSGVCRTTYTSVQTHPTVHLKREFVSYT